MLSAVMFGCTLMQDWPERAGSHSCSCGCRRCTPLNGRQQHEAGIAFQSISQLQGSADMQVSAAQCHTSIDARASLCMPLQMDKSAEMHLTSLHSLQLGLAQLPVYSTNRIYHFQRFQSVQAI